MNRKTKYDLTGQRFGRLLILCISPHQTKGEDTLWIGKCDCGYVGDFQSYLLRKGYTKSCGCLKKLGTTLEHGHTRGRAKTRTYYSWSAMRQRCMNPNNNRYALYGGRGIKVCPEWDLFEQFFIDMGERPDGKTLDRIDVDGDYSAENCRWADVVQQRTNRRDSRRKEV